MKKSFAQSLQSMEREMIRRVVTKVPEWESIDGIIVPGVLSSEQCSSSATASYKRNLVMRIFQNRKIRSLDATGGLGVDSWFLSQTATQHIYMERNGELAKAAGHNFALLGADNITVCNATFAADAATEELLESTKPDLVYLDPARRGAAGNKLVLIEDCEPDVLGLLPMIWRHCPTVLVKLSPMADISMLVSRFGGRLAEIHVVGACGEVKELLLLLRRDFNGQPCITAAEAECTMRFLQQEERDASASFPGSTADFAPGRILYEPSPVLLKAGAFKLISQRSHITKAGRFTHLYIADSPLEFGKCHRIIETLPFDKRSMTDIACRFPGADVTARNIPMKSDELKSRIYGHGKSKAGCRVHVFALTADCTETGSSRIIVLTSPL